jgi:hypothetical protein
MLSPKLLSQLLIVFAARFGRLAQCFVATKDLGAADAADNDVVTAGVVEDRDAAADFVATCGVFHVVLDAVGICQHHIASVGICKHYLQYFAK